MQGGMKACPECGNVSDSGASMCGACGYNFETGKSAERTRIDPTRVPRILADDSLQSPSPSRSGRGAGVFVALAAVVIFGLAAVIIFPDSNLPSSDPFQERTFTRASCTREVGAALERLLRAQAKGQPLNDFFTDFTHFGITSFEYKTMVDLYSDFETQTLLADGRVGKAVKAARKNAAAACRSEYPAG